MRQTDELREGASVTHDEARAELAPLRGFRPDVQALRGIAVLLVVLYHAQLSFPGGFVGVDVFFVISGFVIGRRFVGGLAGGQRGLMGEFYVHRARRILPALSALLAVVILVSPLLAPIGGAREVTPTGIAATLFSANAYLYRATAVGYFGAAAELNPLLHTWSLSVEEQFYFLIPVLLLAGWVIGTRRRNPLRATRVVVWAVLASSFLACVRFSSADGYLLHVVGLRFAFFSPVTRAWEFAVGLALVLLPVRLLTPHSWRRPMIAVGLAMIGVAALAYSDTTVFPGFAALLPVAGTAIVIHAGTRGNVASSAPPWSRPMIWVGNLSYSWYLWHWPIIVFAAALWPQAGVAPLVAAAALSLVPAYASYRVLEHRMRAGPMTRTLPTIGLTAFCLLVPLLAALVAQPIGSLVDHRSSATQLVADSVPGQLGERECNTFAPRGQRPEGRCTSGPASASTRVVLLGDSTAAQLSNALIGAAAEHDTQVEIVTRGGCPFGVIPYTLPPGTVDGNEPDQCTRFYEESLAALEADPPDVVVMSSATDHWVFGGGYRLTDPGTGEPVATVGEQARLYEEGLSRAVHRLRDAGIRVAIVESHPKPSSFGDVPYDFRACSRLALMLERSRCLFPPFTIGLDGGVSGSIPDDRANQLDRSVAKREGASTWSLATAICPQGRCEAVRDGHLVWRDGAHISGATSERLAPVVAADIERTMDSAPGTLLR